jgi:hypothetical protein
MINIEIFQQVEITSSNQLRNWLQPLDVTHFQNNNGS